MPAEPNRNSCFPCRGLLEDGGGRQRTALRPVRSKQATCPCHCRKKPRSTRSFSLHGRSAVMRRIAAPHLAPCPPEDTLPPCSDAKDHSRHRRNHRHLNRHTTKGSW